MDADLGAMTVQRRDRLRVSPVTRWSRSFSDGESHGSNHEPPGRVSSHGSAIHLVRASLRDYKKKNATQNLLDGLLMEALQRLTRPSRRGCNPTPSWAGSLSLGR